jgi:predicted PurR-regulated permease PerM
MEPHEGDADLVPIGLRAAAGWTWRMVVVGLGLYLLLRLMDTFKVLLVPVLVALLLVALLRPLVDLMTARPASEDRTARAGLPKAIASLAALLLALAVVAGLVTLIGQQISTGFSDLQTQAVGGWHELQRQLAASPLHLTSEQIGQFVDQAAAGVQGNGNRVVTGAVRVGSTAADIGTGFFIVLFSTYFFLSGGDRIWAWVVRLFPRTARERVDGAGIRAWSTLTSYVRATVVVALVDGIGVGVVAAVLRVPLAIPLGVLVFLGAFVPVVGAFVSGIVAVLVALVAEGPVVALLMLAGVVAVQQIEAHVLQPFLMGRAVRVHPLAVILSIGAGVLLAGIVGGLFAVPLAAVVNVVAHYLSGEEQSPPDEGPLADRPEEQSERDAIAEV